MGGEGGVGGGGLGTHWKPLNTSKYFIKTYTTRTKGGEQWGQWGGQSVVDGGGGEGGEGRGGLSTHKAAGGVGAVRAVGAEGVWAHIGVRRRGVTGAV